VLWVNSGSTVTFASTLPANTFSGNSYNAASNYGNCYNAAATITGSCS